MGFISEFREFAVKGNVIDLAVGVIIGGAFGKIVTSVIDDLIMPLVGQVVGNVDFSSLYVPLSDNVKEAQTLGLKVVPWTVNVPAEMARLIDLGVDGLITDYPDRALPVLAAKGLKSR